MTLQIQCLGMFLGGVHQQTNHLMIWDITHVFVLVWSQWALCEGELVVWIKRGS